MVSFSDFSVFYWKYLWIDVIFNFPMKEIEGKMVPDLAVMLIDDIDICMTKVSI